jgi:hypothetical protein
MKIPIIVCCLILFISFISCKKDTTSVINGNDPDTTSHNYQWVVDTLQGYPDAMQVLISNI